MGKIHELLAVEGDLKAKANKALAEVRAFFNAGAALFVGQMRTYKPLQDNGDQYPPEIKVLGANVPEQLERIRKEFGNWVDLAVSKEVSNSQENARAMIFLDGFEYRLTLPVTALLNLESKLESLRDIYNAIPTNDVTDVWYRDIGNNLWRSEPTVTYKGKKVNERFVKAEATDRHPAQVDIVTVDVREGSWTTTKTSGMLSPVEKNDRLTRLESLLQAVRKARQRANDVEAADIHIAEAIFDYVEGV